MLKCRKCAAHDIVIPVRGHARTCPYRLCPCEKCLKVVSKRLSSVKRRYKNSDVVFVNVECNSGNVRVQAVPKSLVDTIKSENHGVLPEMTVDSVLGNEKMSTSLSERPKFLDIETISKSNHPSSLVPNIFNLFAYLKMQPEQQLNFLSTYAWILQTSQFLKHNCDE